MRAGIYVVEALDIANGETVRKVVVAESASGALIAAKFRGEAEVGRIGDYEPGLIGSRFGPTVIATQITPAKEARS